MQLVSVDKDFFAKCKKYGTDRKLKMYPKISIFRYRLMLLRGRGKDMEYIILNYFRWIKNMYIHIKYRKVHIL